MVVFRAATVRDWVFLKHWLDAQIEATASPAPSAGLGELSTAQHQDQVHGAEQGCGWVGSVTKLRG